MTKQITKTFEDFEGDTLQATFTRLGTHMAISHPLSDEEPVDVVLNRDESRRVLDFLTQTYQAGLHTTLRIQDSESTELELYVNDAVTLVVSIEPGDAPADHTSILLHAWQWNELVEAMGHFNY